MIKFRFNKACDVVRNYKPELRNMFDNAKSFCWTQAELNGYIAKHVWEAEKYRRLPQWGQSTLSGYIDALRDIHQTCLEFRYLINGKWYLPQEVGHSRNGGNGPDFSEAGRDNGHFVYVVNTETGPAYKLFF